MRYAKSRNIWCFAKDGARVRALSDFNAALPQNGNVHVPGQQ